MSEPKHTPGPWTIQEYGDDECPTLVLHRGETENRICFMATPGSHGDPAIIEADARLIAAAPDLAAFANALLIYKIDGDPANLLWCRFDDGPACSFFSGSPEEAMLLRIEASRSAAIAKATGLAG